MFVFQDVLKTSWRYNCKTSCKHVLKMSWRRLEDVLGRRIANTSWRRLEDVLEDEKCYAEDVFKTSSRRLGKQEMFVGMLIKRICIIRRTRDAFLAAKIRKKWFRKVFKQLWDGMTDVPWSRKCLSVVLR